MGKPTICIGENKDADQLRGNREADQRLCFRYSDSTITLKSEISSFYLFSVLVLAGLCRTCPETTLLVFPRGGSYCFFITGIYPTEKEGDDEGLSTGVKIAIGVGVGVGVLVIIVIAILCYCCICKRRG